MRRDEDVCGSKDARDGKADNPPSMQSRKGYKNDVFHREVALVLIAKRVGVAPILATQQGDFLKRISTDHIKSVKPIEMNICNIAANLTLSSVLDGSNFLDDFLPSDFFLLNSLLWFDLCLEYDAKAR